MRGVHGRILASLPHLPGRLIMYHLAALLALGYLETACSAIDRPGRKVVLFCRKADGRAQRIVMDQGEFACRFAP